MANNESVKSSGAASAIISALPAEVRGIISMLLLFVSFFAALYAIINMPDFFKNITTSTSPVGHCWELSRIDEFIFKFNKCTGDIE